MFKERREAILKLAREGGYEFVGATTPENLYYTTGFWGDGVVIMDEGSTTLFTNALECERAESLSKDCEVLAVELGGSVYERVAERVGSRRACFDEVNSSSFKILRERLGEKVEFDQKPFYYVRRFKDESELSAIAAASKALDRLYGLAEEVMRPRVGEREVMAQLMEEALRLGCDPVNYHAGTSPLIVASGPNGAYPHAEATERELEEGDLVVVDLFIRCRGYIADATRTFAIGMVTREAKEAYEAVRRAQEAAIEALKAGVMARDVDGAARRVLEDLGYGQRFLHGTGHGVGLEIHEPPFIRPNSGEPLHEGDVVTIEPAVYLPRKFGIRIEDTVHVPRRAKVLTGFTRELLVLG